LSFRPAVDPNKANGRSKSHNESNKCDFSFVEMTNLQITYVDESRKF